MRNRPIPGTALTLTFIKVAWERALVAMIVLMLTASARADIKPTVTPGVGSATSCSFSGDNLTCNKPPSTVSGHLLLFCEYDGSAGTVSGPTRFTQVSNVWGKNGRNYGRATCYFKVVGSSEPSSYTISVSSSPSVGDGVLIDIANVGSTVISGTPGTYGTTAYVNPYTIPAPTGVAAQSLNIACGSQYNPQTINIAAAQTVVISGGVITTCWSYTGPPTSLTITSAGTSHYYSMGEQIAIAPLQVGTRTAKGAIQGFPTGFNADVATGTPPYSSAANPLTGYGLNGCFNPVAYGADPTGTRDSSAGLNAAVAPACAAHGTICLPAGSYHLDSQPWLIQCPSGYLPNVVGAGKVASIIYNRLGSAESLGGAPGIELAGGQTLADYGGASTIIQPALVGTGNSWNTDGKAMLFDLNYPLNSLDPLNGLSAFTVETCFSTTENNATEVLATSDGAAAPSASGCGAYGPPTYRANAGYTCKGAFWFGLGDDGRLYGAMNTGGTWSGLLHSTSAVGRNTTVCAQMSYDGRGIRLLHGAPGTTMTEDAKVAATGRVTEREDEDLTMLMQAFYWHLQDPSYWWQGRVDTFRISKIARCTSDSGCKAPNTKLSGDSNTIFLENWTNASNLPLVGPEYTNGIANTSAPTTQSWMVMDNESAGNPANNHPEVRDFSVVGGGGPDFHVNASAPQFINLEAGDPALGRATWGFMTSNYGSYGIIGYNLWGAATVSAVFNTGLTYLYGLNMQCGLTCGEYGGPIISGLQILTSSKVKWGIILDAWTNLDSFYDDAENGGSYPDVLISNMASPAGPSTTFTNSQFLFSGGADVIQLDGQTFNTTFINSTFDALNGASSYINDTHATGSNSIVFDNDEFYGGTPCLANGSTLTATAVATWQIQGGCTIQQTTLTGTTAGHAIFGEPVISSNSKKFRVYLSSYENTTGTPQTIGMPVAFTTAISSASAISGKCAGLTATTSTVTLPSSMRDRQTGLCEFDGY